MAVSEHEQDVALPDEISVNVTQDDIDHSKTGDPDNCAIAVAFNRQTGYSCRVSDGLIKVRPSDLFSDERDVRYTYPDQAQDFIDHFDNGETVAPFTFTAVRQLVKAGDVTRVTVTRGDIDGGLRCNRLGCPAARAIARAVPGSVSKVVRSVAYLHIGDRILVASLPDSAGDFVERFDNGETVAPFEFEITWEERGTAGQAPDEP